MNSDNIVKSVDKLISPVNSNKYIRYTLLVVLLFNAQYFIPRYMMPKVLIRLLKKYSLLRFVFTFFLCYLFTNDINLTIVISSLIHALSFINIKTEFFGNTYDVDSLINKHNYYLDKVIYKEKVDNTNTLGFIKPHQLISPLNNNPQIPNIPNISSVSKEGVMSNMRNSDIKKSNLGSHLKNISDGFDFSKDNLKYLNQNLKN